MESESCGGLHGGTMKKDKIKKLAEQITKTLFGRMFLVGLALILQFGWILLTVVTLDNRYPIVSILIQIASVLAVLWIVSKDINPAYKLAWTILILAMPVAGTVIYFLFGKSRLARSLNGRFMEEYANTEQLLKEEPQTREKLEEISTNAAIQSRYIRDLAGFPAYQKTQTRYFHVGEELYKEMIAQLKRRSISFLWSILSSTTARCGREFWIFWRKRRGWDWMSA